MSKRVSATQPNPGPSAAKAVRVENGNGGLPWQLEAGMILKVQLRNFMCHQNYEYVPNTRLNFLCGANGSGKSAVLTAIVFALGGTARVSNRGSSNKAFIRSGQQQASVEIQLWNDGDQSYRKDLYGRTVSIVRTVTASGSSSYKIKDEHGTVVKNRKIKEELDRMLGSFNIQVDNPIAVLNQDTAKSFLYKCDNSKLYDFFMRATQLEACKNDYVTAAEEKNAAEVTFSEKEANLPKLKEEEEKWNKKLQLLRSQKERKAKLTTKRNELAWALVLKAEALHNAAKTDKQTVEIKITKCQDAVVQETEKQKSLKERKLELERKIQDILSQAESDQSRVDELRENYLKAREEERKVTRQLAEAKSQEDSKRKDSDSLKVEIERIKSRGNEEFESGCQKREEDIRALEEAMENSQKQIVSKQTHIQNLSTTVHAVRAEEQSSQAKLGLLNRQLGDKKSRLHAVEGQQDRLVLFGEKMPYLVAQINKCDQFQKKPLGPIGAEIELINTASKEQAVVIEAEMKQLLSSFVVDNFEDRKTLLDLQNACKTRYPIIVSKFVSAAYDVSQGKCKHPSYPTVMDLLKVRNPVVLNCLIDQKKIERVLMVPTEVAAQELFKGVVPNCVMGLTHTGSQYFPAPNYRSYTQPMDSRRAGVLQSSVEELVSALKREVKEISSEIAKESAVLQEIRQRLSTFSAELRKTEDSVTQIKTSIRVAQQKIGVLKIEREASKPPNVTALEEDWDRIDEELGKLTEKLEGLNEDMNKAKKSSEEAKAAFDNEKSHVQEKTNSSDPLNEELEGIEAKTRKCEDQKKYYRGKETEYGDRLKEAEKKEKDADKLRQERLATAEKRCAERLQPTVSAEMIHREICSMEESLKKREDIEETFEEVTIKLEEAHANYEKKKRQVSQVKSHISFLKVMIRRRELGFAELRRSIGRRVKIHFSHYLQSRKFSGELTFDHNEQTLDISVAPDGGADVRRNMKTLSGGEKSYSTISLILSLWDVMHPPFRVLDEFDVFMDMVNRRVALTQITDYAKDARKYQYIFLTPLNTDGIAMDEDIKILRLEKNQ